ncbi:uncharacterized protein C8R40DRAFT_1072599 [Lentinula edodes]|uniref:uncharacterized protein n=1 Tax=Lentinula edodes TaxID=5353 RepID=UPI001E8D2DA8|nr:uncharacterized protein C8R40DRAFT_1072599 [Lentinula edodes]KAH7871301.1 hypothetical protein C8R40DRAFT_1072599 [Lentinula edodes]
MCNLENLKLFLPIVRPAQGVCWGVVHELLHDPYKLVHNLVKASSWLLSYVGLTVQASAIELYIAYTTVSTSFNVSTLHSDTRLVRLIGFVIHLTILANVHQLEITEIFFAFVPLSLSFMPRPSPARLPKIFCQRTLQTVSPADGPGWLYAYVDREEIGSDFLQFGSRIDVKRNPLPSAHREVFFRWPLEICLEDDRLANALEGRNLLKYVSNCEIVAVMQLYNF